MNPSLNNSKIGIIESYFDEDERRRLGLEWDLKEE
jgi:hypothetical protein